MATNYDIEYAESVKHLADKLKATASLTAHCVSKEADFSDEAQTKLRLMQLEIALNNASKNLAELHKLHNMWLGNRALRYRESR